MPAPDIAKDLAELQARLLRKTEDATHTACRDARTIAALELENDGLKRENEEFRRVITLRKGYGPA